MRASEPVAHVYNFRSVVGSRTRKYRRRTPLEWHLQRETSLIKVEDASNRDLARTLVIKVSNFHDAFSRSAWGVD